MPSYSRFVKIFAIAKWLAKTAGYKRINFYNFGFKVALSGKDKLTIGRANKFFNSELNAGDMDTKYIMIGENNVFHSGTVIAGNGGRIEIGDRNMISSNVFINGQKGFLKLRNNIFVGHNVIIQGFGGVEVCDGAMIAANSFISSSDHNFEDPFSADYLLKESGKPVFIGEKVWVGANTVITAGVRIGDFSVIGAGSVVTRDVPDFSMAVGAPARVIKTFNRASFAWENKNGQ